MAWYSPCSTMYVHYIFRTLYIRNNFKILILIMFFHGAVFSYGAVRCGPARFYRTAPYDFSLTKPHRGSVPRYIR